MQTITFKPGDDIRWAGQITREGVTDFTGYTLASQVRAKPTRTGIQGRLLATVDIAWADEAGGFFLFEVPREVTRDWPEGAVLVIDIRVEAPDDSWTRTETVEINTIPGVTA